MRPVKASGFSLLELMLALSIASITLLAALHIFTQMWAQARLGQLRVDTQQTFYQLGHWSVRALLTELQLQPDAELASVGHCILLGSIGLRVRSQQLQWRPEGGDCESSGWHGLHDPSHLRIHGIHLAENQFCITGSYRGAPDIWQWCYPWYA